MDLRRNTPVAGVDIQSPCDGFCGGKCIPRGLVVGLKTERETLTIFLTVEFFELEGLICPTNEKNLPAVLERLPVVPPKEQGIDSSLR